MRQLFGTDGVRGKANVYPLTSEMALQIGRATAYIFKNAGKRHRIVIGKDTRLSGYMIEQALGSGICSMGVDAILLGPLPTPAVAFITSAMRADAGIMISASHNPYYDNGIKIFSSDGYKLPDDEELRIEELIFKQKIDSMRPTAGSIGKAYRVDDASGRYIEYCKSVFPKSMTLDGIKIVLDCANGAAYKVAPIILSELGAEVVSCGCAPNGQNINKKCGALFPDLISNQVVRHRADIGMALDGDADRVVFVDELGQIMDGDCIMAICAKDMLESKRLRKKTLVATVMSNLGLDHFMKSIGGKILRTKVGDRYVIEAMKQGNYSLGGEQSGHIIFADYSTTGDGIVSALRLLSVMKKSGRKLSELAMIMNRLPQVIKNVKVKERLDLTEIHEVSDTIEKVEKKLKDKGRVLVRYSGTEPLIRIMVEGPSEAQIKGYAEEIKKSIRKTMG